VVIISVGFVIGDAARLFVVLRFFFIRTLYRSLANYGGNKDESTF
jgi:hypothetical protein